MTRRWMAPAAVAALLVCAPAGVIAAPASPAGSAAFDRAAWLSDYAYLKAQLQASYSHLAWFASPQGGVDLPDLDRRTLQALNAATSDDQAHQALRAFVAGLHDGHFSELPAVVATTTAKAPKAAEPPERDLAADDAVGGCAALGYGDRSQDFFSLPFETLAGFKLEADGEQTGFRAGTIALDGRTIGVVRIRNFSERQFPDACIRAWNANPKLAKTDPAFGDAVVDAWFQALADQLKRFRAEGVGVVLVDVGSNSGGNDAGDWAPRLFTSKPVRSARLLMAAAPVGQTYVDEQIGEIGKATALDSSPATRATAAKALSFFQARKAELAARGCDMSWAWRERRPFDPMGCSRLIDSGFASGAFANLPAEAWGDRHAAAKLYWPATVEPWRGAWDGAVYVLTSPTTYSSAEMFAAVMQDNAIAKTIGARTGGDGCGFMEDTDPIVLPHSRVQFRAPNCVRLRADGSDEVAGVAPDLPAPALEGESARARALKVLTAIAAGAAPG